jgi:hypothetical protein
MHEPEAASWGSATHDWATELDVEHLERIRQEPAVFAPTGALHLVPEVLAYAADEARASRAGKAIVALYPDGSVSIEDNGRGTAVRLDSQGRALKKPVMATKDLRFFDFPGAAVLPDGHPRRGMSVVAALSEWLVHVNRRRNGPGRSATPTASRPPISPLSRTTAQLAPRCAFSRTRPCCQIFTFPRTSWSYSRLPSARTSRSRWPSISK